MGEGTDADRGETAEWGAAMREAELADQLDASLVEESPFTEEGEPIDEYEPEDLPMSDEPFAEPEGPKFVRAENKIHEHLAPDVDPAFEWSEPAPRTEREPDREPRFTLPERQPGVESQFGARDEEAESVNEPEPEGEVRILRAVPDDGPVAALIADSDNHRKEVASRVSFLFPRPETTEWSVHEVGYDRKRRAQVSDEDL